MHNPLHAPPVEKLPHISFDAEKNPLFADTRFPFAKNYEFYGGYVVDYAIALRLNSMQNLGNISIFFRMTMHFRMPPARQRILRWDRDVGAGFRRPRARKRGRE